MATKTIKVQGHAGAKATASAIADTRYSFSAQFIRGAAKFAKLSRDIEADVRDPPGEEAKSDHRAFVVAAVMQSCAGLEAEIAEVAAHGPGHHLGSNGVDARARDFLQPMEDMINGQGVLERYQLVLHLLGKDKFDKGSEPFQSAALLVRLRNELVHYKSRWGADMASVTLFDSLRQLKHRKPPFVSEHSNFFPHQCLGADCALWSVRVALDFIGDFYKRLGVACHLAAYRPAILALLSQE